MKQKKINLRALAAIAVMLLIIILLENISSIIPGLPQVFWPTSPLFTVLKKAAVYSLVAVSMNLLNGFTGLFSLGQAGFMLLGAYTYAILMVPAASKEQVYYLFGGCAFNSSIIDILGGIFGTTGVGGAISMIIGCIIAIILAGCVAGFFAYLIGFPVLRLKSDYLAIATLGFAEILRAIFQWQKLGKITNGANMIKGFPTFSSFNITDGAGHEIVRLSTFVPFLISTVCIVIIVLLINSSYGRAFKSIRDDEVAAEAMGINLFSHKMLSFVISSFFAGVGGALFAMYVANAQAKAFTSVMTYEILLIVVIGGIGSVSGSVLATFLYVACSEWWLRFLDSELYIGSFKVPFLRNGFRMVVFSIVIMVIVLFFSQGIMGEKEISLGALFDRSSRKKERKE
ncbi:branched-chain amino acid ABC transporter permease [Butyrivibrio sp. FC2001]|jgi:branched-chain amino acid transport system permease protein|uniref:branched-chain amino acid ABC transporter permease n=1 Tax=Butyrivibrio sp. FC2001 TaxID=1280671 RepID=UPI00041B2105|nr:branched-chain amino acid ABC transporter permease [Butyrivibrio sp. FC2001]MCR5343290.1 branched-chain amino acid ABC transporter permease [Butyrivibrio sp.]